jgi:Na+-translocating ferredoxin:NAD+ oxidoreductase RnfC subunit
MLKANLKWSGSTTVKPHPMRDGRRVPIKSLMKRLHILQYDRAAPLQEGVLSPRRVVLPLKQGAGSANQALVKPGDRVAAGQPLGTLPEKALGAIVHAPFAGLVAEVTPGQIVLNRV